MCKVKKGSDVKKDCDLQNLITHVILCQTGDFTVSDILKEVNSRLENSVYQEKANRAKIESLCRRTLVLMEFSDTVYSYGDDCYCLTVSYPSYMPSLGKVNAG